MEDLEYLEPDFDPSTLKVAQLRSILVEYNVDWPSSAKKGELVDLFNQHIAPKAKRLRAARARTKPSSKGIVDVPSSQASVADEDEEEEKVVPPPRSARSSRRSTRQPTEDAEAILFPPPSVSSRRSTRQHTEDLESILLAPPSASSRVTSARNSRTPDVEATESVASTRRGRKSVTPAAYSEEPPTTGRRGRKSVTPAVKEESPEPYTRRRADDESPFTQDNPFQSGSSPITAPVETSERRRKTVGPVERKERRKSSATRRKTEVPMRVQDDEAKGSTSSIFEMPVAKMSKKTARKASPINDLEDGTDAGEEFTAEEEQEMALERSQGGTAVVPARRKKPKSSGPGLKTPLLVSLLAASGGLFHVWNQEKLEVGYCGVGRPSTSIAGYEVPEWASHILPQCEQCPQHAFCYPRLETTCEHGFILNPHPLTAGGKLPLPLPPTCEPDTEKAKKVKTVADRAVEELRERNAKFECSQLTEDDGKPAKSAAIAEDSLKATVSALKKRSMSQEEFDDLWKDAIGEILGRDEITSGVDGIGNGRSLASNSLARIPLACAVRRSIRTALVKHLWPIVIALLFVASGGYTRYTITYNRDTEAKAKQLASYALDRLSTQATLHAHEPSTYPEAFISMTHLRDDVLRDEFSAARRIQLWDKVQKKVEGNSNVRPMVREGRHGDRSRVWEWVGAVGALEDVSGSAKREGSRYSIGSVQGGTPSDRLLAAADRGNASEMKETRRFEEGRPFY